MPTTIGLVLIIVLVLAGVVGVVMAAVRGGRRRTDIGHSNDPQAPFSAEHAAAQAHRQADRGGML